MSATAAGRVLACLALVAACGLALLVRERGEADGILVAVTALAVVGGVVTVLRDVRRARAHGGAPVARRDGR